MKKMWAAAAAAGAAAVLISGCALNTGARVYDNERALAGKSNSYNLVNYSGSMSDNTVSGSAENWKEWTQYGNSIQMSRQK